MEKQTKVFDETDGIQLQQVGEDHCLVDFEGTRIVLSYDATCDLATRLAYFLCQVEENAASTESCPHVTPIHLN